MTRTPRRPIENGQTTCGLSEGVTIDLVAASVRLVHDADDVSRALQLFREPHRGFVGEAAPVGRLDRVRIDDHGIGSTLELGHGMNLFHCEGGAAAGASDERFGPSGHDLPKVIHRDGEHDSVSDRLNPPDRNLERASMEHAPVGAQSIRNVLSQLDLERLHPPRGGIEEEQRDLTDRQPIRGDHGSATKVLVRKTHGDTSNFAGHPAMTALISIR
jgi:hypothetical protein